MVRMNLLNIAVLWLNSLHNQLHNLYINSITMKFVSNFLIFYQVLFYEFEIILQFMYFLGIVICSWLFYAKFN